MANKNFLLLSLEDEKTKKIANIVGNESCKKILDFLAENEATESELAKKLNIPISTIHYNLQQLMEADLIRAEEFHYSPKGKEVMHYKLANKYILISPKKTYGIKQKLRNILPVALIAAGAAGAIQVTSKLFSKSMSLSQESFMVVKDVGRNIVAEKSAEITSPSIDAVADSGIKVADEIVAEKVYLLPENIALWFLVGALFALGVYFLWTWIRKDIS